MNTSTLRLVAVALSAFVIGVAASRATAPVRAAAPADLPTPGTVTPNLQHVHAEANEVQYVVSGSGTEWLGDRQIGLKPGLLIVIPAGTPHGGTIDSGLKILAIKTPPQASADIRAVP